jgi:hypothetical protein
MNTKNIPGDKGRPARKAGNIIAICPENAETTTSHKLMDLNGLL